MSLRVQVVALKSALMRACAQNPRTQGIFFKWELYWLGSSAAERRRLIDLQQAGYLTNSEYLSFELMDARMLIGKENASAAGTKDTLKIATRADAHRGQYLVAVGVTIETEDAPRLLRERNRYMPLAVSRCVLFAQTEFTIAPDAAPEASVDEVLSSYSEDEAFPPHHEQRIGRHARFCHADVATTDQGMGPLDMTHGRQLLIDDWPLQHTTHLDKSRHRAERQVRLELLRRDGTEAPPDWQIAGIAWVAELRRFVLWHSCSDDKPTRTAPNSHASAHSTTPKQQCWHICAAMSSDMRRFGDSHIVAPAGRDDCVPRPNLPVVTLGPGGELRFVLSVLPMSGGGDVLSIFKSKDGLLWQEANPGGKIVCDDGCAVFYNPLRKVWLLSSRAAQ